MSMCCGSCSLPPVEQAGAPTVGPAVRKECGAATRAMAARELVKPQSCLCPRRTWEILGLGLEIDFFCGLLTL